MEEATPGVSRDSGHPGDAAPAVSIIVPAYNAAAHLEESLTGLLRQSFGDFEIVVVDDGSTDETAEIAGRLAATHREIRLISLAENGGVARARERAVQESAGEYLWFVDADDRRSDDALDRLVDTARATGADVVICSAEFVSPDGRRRPLPAPALPRPVSGRLAFRLLLDGEITGHLWNKLVRRELATTIDYTPAKVHSDLAMVAQLIAAANRVASIPDTLYSYLLRSGSIIHSGSKRAESLVLVEGAVSRAADELDPRIRHTPQYRYFLLRFIVLSAMKDALLGSYDDRERRVLVATLRQRLSWRAIALVGARGDWKRLVLAVTAKVSTPLHLRVLRASSAL